MSAAKTWPDTLSGVLDALDALHEPPYGYAARCPACESKGRLLSIAMQDDGKVHFACISCDEDGPAEIGLTPMTPDFEWTDNGDGYSKDTPETNEDEEPAKKTQVALVVEHVREHYRIIKANDGKVYAAPRSGPRIVTPMKFLEATVASELYDDEGLTPSEGTRRTAMSILKADGLRAEEEQVFLRSASLPDDGVVYVDLGDRDQTVIKITGEGWEPVTREGEGPLFRRVDAMGTLPLPERGTEDARAELADLLGWEVDSKDFRLAWGWLVCSYFSDIPRPLLWATGTQGAGKTTRLKLLLGLIDPVDELGSPPGKNESDDNARLNGRYVPTFDNVRNISPATSDWICRLVTGVSIEKRTLYSDDGLHANIVRRAALATSINMPHGIGPDALERMIVLHLDTVSKRLTERAIQRKFKAAAPRILAAVFDDVAGIIARLDEVSGDAELVRMADYHVNLLALDIHTGGKFAEAYADTIKNAMRDRVEDDPWLKAVVNVVDSNGGEIWGSPGALVTEIAEMLKKMDDTLTDYAISKFPSSRGIRNALREAVVPLQTAGITFSEQTRQGVRGFTLKRVVKVHEGIAGLDPEADAGVDEPAA